MADPHILYTVLAVVAGSLALWVTYVLVRMPPAVPAKEARPKLGSYSDIQDDQAPKDPESR